jgi:hypothetical protein
MSGTIFLSREATTDFLRDREFPELAIRATVKRPTVNHRRLLKSQTFADGFMVGWLSLVDPGMAVPEKPLPPATSKISAYLQGLLSGIEAAKAHRVSLCDIRDI